MRLGWTKIICSVCVSVKRNVTYKSVILIIVILLLFILHLCLQNRVLSLACFSCFHFGGYFWRQWLNKQCSYKEKKCWLPFVNFGASVLELKVYIIDALVVPRSTSWATLIKNNSLTCNPPIVASENVIYVHWCTCLLWSHIILECYLHLSSHLWLAILLLGHMSG